MGTQKNRLNETVLLSTHNLCLNLKDKKIITIFRNSVQNELTADEDRDILREHDVSFGPAIIAAERRGKANTHPAGGSKSSG